MNAKACSRAAIAVVLLAVVAGACTGAATASPAGPAAETAAPNTAAPIPSAVPSEPKGTPAATPDLRPVPLPQAVYSGEVVDPALATLPLADALDIGRTVPPIGTGNWIGTNPVARLMHLSSSHPVDGFGPTLAWVIVTDDAPPFGGTGLPTTSSPPPYHGCLSWTIIAMDGRVLDHVQSRYLGPNYPPALPRS